MNKTDKRVLNLKEIYYEDLQGNKVQISFPQEDFGNALYRNGTSLYMDEFARAIFKTGKAELNDQVIAELTELAPRLWQHRAASALLETISKL